MDVANRPLDVKDANGTPLDISDSIELMVALKLHQAEMCDCITDGRLGAWLRDNLNRSDLLEAVERLSAHGYSPDAIVGELYRRLKDEETLLNRKYPQQAVNALNRAAGRMNTKLGEVVTAIDNVATNLGTTNTDVTKEIKKAATQISRASRSPSSTVPSGDSGSFQRQRDLRVRSLLGLTPSTPTDLFGALKQRYSAIADNTSVALQGYSTRMATRSNGQVRVDMFASGQPITDALGGQTAAQATLAAYASAELGKVKEQLRRIKPSVSNVDDDALNNIRGAIQHICDDLLNEFRKQDGPRAQRVNLHFNAILGSTRMSGIGLTKANPPSKLDNYGDFLFKDWTKPEIDSSVDDQQYQDFLDLRATLEALRTRWNNRPVASPGTSPSGARDRGLPFLELRRALDAVADAARDLESAMDEAQRDVNDRRAKKFTLQNEEISIDKWLSWITEFAGVDAPPQLDYGKDGAELILDELVILGLTVVDPNKPLPNLDGPASKAITTISQDTFVAEALETLQARLFDAITKATTTTI